VQGYGLFLIAATIDACRHNGSIANVTLLGFTSEHGLVHAEGSVETCN
jgi:hypothetical protein